MGLVYKGRSLDKETYRREAHRDLQRKQMKLVDEDGTLKRLQKEEDALKKQLEETKKTIEARELEILNLRRAQDRIRKELTSAERNIVMQQNKIRKFEHEIEELRQIAYRRDKSGEEE